MNPGITVMPLASMVLPAAAEGAPACTETIFPARTTIDPRSITVLLATLLASTIRALVMVMSCAESDPSAPRARQASSVEVCRFMQFFLPRQVAKAVTMIYARGERAYCAPAGMGATGVDGTSLIVMPPKPMRR